jgi:antitoxin component YwqK of YwqJK toxin-antitoxin module
MIILLLFYLNNIKCYSICIEDNRSLTELLFQGQPGTIFTCKILTSYRPNYNKIIKKKDTLTGKIEEIEEVVDVLSEDGISDCTSTAVLIYTYFGKVDSNIVTLKGSCFQVGKIYLICASQNGKIFYCGGNCDKWTRQVSDDPNLTFEVNLIKEFSDIFKNKSTGKFSFKNKKGFIIAEGQYKKGEPVKVWKHYYDTGTIKSEYDLKNNITKEFSKDGCIISKVTKNNNISDYEKYSPTINGLLQTRFVENFNEDGSIMEIYGYYDNRRLKSVHSQINIKNKKSNSWSSGGKTGIYEEYYENGQIKIKGQYKNRKRVGLWKWYNDDGSDKGEVDYKDGEKGNE